MAGELQGDVQAGLVRSLFHMSLGLESPPSPVPAPFHCQTLTLCAPCCWLCLVPSGIWAPSSVSRAMQGPLSLYPGSKVQPVPKLQRKLTVGG